MRKVVFVLLSAFLTVAEAAVSVFVDEYSIGCGTVAMTTESPGFNDLSVVTLKAAPAVGYSFSGWYVDGRPAAWPVDYRLPEVQSVPVPQSAVITASFVAVENDGFEFDVADDLAQFACGEQISVPLEIDSESFPTLSFRGLPTGLRYDVKSLTVSGRPVTPGSYPVTVTGVNASGFGFEQTFILMVGKLQSDALAGIDVEVPVDEYCVFDFAQAGVGFGSRDGYLFDCQRPRRSTRLSNLPPGMVWDASMDLLYGTPTRAGSYTIMASVSFIDGTAESASLSFTVLAPAPEDYDVSMSSLRDLVVGDTLDADYAELGVYSNRVGLVSVSGLPSGLSLVVKPDASGVLHLGVSGCVRKAGLYTVVMRINVEDGDGMKTVSAQEDVIVADAMMEYFEVGYFDDLSRANGTVSGGGPVSIGRAVSAKATPRKGYVFAGWYDSDGNPVELDEDQDYRDATLTFHAGTDLSFYKLRGRFIPTAEDTIAFGGELEDDEFVFSTDGILEEPFSVDSGSRPVFTSKGLPPGVSLVTLGSGDFALWYDTEIAQRTPTPGKYHVTLTATNKSGMKDHVSFTLVVNNWHDDRVNVEDDYGNFSPGYEISPIDLNGAVDFSIGESFAVSGLPKGLVFNKTDVSAKGIAANTITGIPTSPGNYTLTFKAKVMASVRTNELGRILREYETVTVTSSICILPWPALETFLEDDAESAGCTVTGLGNYKPGTKVTLKAKPAPGWVFAGWSGLDDTTELTSKNPSLTLVTGEDDQFLMAEFVPVQDDYLFLDAPFADEQGFSAVWQQGIDVADQDGSDLVEGLIETVSYPTVSVAGLPAGVKFKPGTFQLSGKPTKAGVFYVTITARNLGGYSFVRVLRLAVLEKDGSLPQEPAMTNAAAIDCTSLEGLTTGVYYPSGAKVLLVPRHPETGAGVKKVGASGLPAGLSLETRLVESEAVLSLVGTPTKPGRTVVTFTVGYDNGKSAKTQSAVVVEDGGSFYLEVVNKDPTRGKVSGGGVYASGSKVKLTAQPVSGQVFSGWRLEDGTLFTAVRDLEGIDPRAATATFPFRPSDFAENPILTAGFVSATEDIAPQLEQAGPVWSVVNGESSTFTCRARSASLPKWTVKGLPKGLTFDAGRERFCYDGVSAVVPGIYAVTVSAVNQSRQASGPLNLEVRVANLESPVINGVSADMESHQLSVGVKLPEAFPRPVVDEGWSLSVKGLPSGLSFKNGTFIGLPAKVGIYTVTLTATQGSGVGRRVETATITLWVNPLPASLCGTFNGFLEGDGGHEDRCGIFTATVASSGKVSVKIASAAGNRSYSANLDSFDAESGLASLQVTDKDGSVLNLQISASEDWRSWPLSGEFVEGTRSYGIQAQRHPWTIGAGVEEVAIAAKQLPGGYIEGGLVFTILANGTVRIAGTWEGLRVTGTSQVSYQDGWCIPYWLKSSNNLTISGRIDL